MIVRDEERHLPGCLDSIRDVVDEIVIVDTGSVDATTEIAHAYGARVEHHRWRDDFAQARNVGLDLAGGRWILYIDADERLRERGRDQLRRTLEDAQEIALRLLLVPAAGMTPAWEYRLWRSDPRIRFDGQMHEKVAPAIHRVSISDGLMIGEVPVVLDHLGYDGDQSHKHRRNLPLLRAQLSDDPSSVYNWRHLATVLNSLGETEQAQDALDRATEIARASGGLSSGLAFVDLISRLADGGSDTTALVDEAVSRYPDNAALAWQKVCAEIDAGRHAQALHLLERLDVDTEMPVEDTISYPIEMFAADIPDARGLCLFRLGRYREASEAYRQAERFPVDSLARRAKRMLAEHRARANPSAPFVGGPAPWAARELLAGLAVDIGGVPVGLRATDSMRARAIHALLGLMPRTGDEPVARLAFGSHRRSLPAREPDECHGEVRLWCDDETLAVAHGGAVTGHVEDTSAIVGGYSADLTRVFRQVAPFLLARQLAAHGRFLLHAGAIQRDGRVVLALGGSGSGKSTLILGALEAGWSALADDHVLVCERPDGLRVMGVPRPLTVPADAVSHDATSWPIPGDPRGRLRLPFDEWDRGWRSVAAVAVVSHGDRDEPSVTEVPREEILAFVIRAMLSRRRVDVRAFMRPAMTLGALPALRLAHSNTVSGRPLRAANALAAEIAALE
jgi:tetratricopeptide (TPR) repeat protein